MILFQAEADLDTLEANDPINARTLIQSTRDMIAKKKSERNIDDKALYKNMFSQNNQ